MRREAGFAFILFCYSLLYFIRLPLRVHLTSVTWPELPLSKVLQHLSVVLIRLWICRTAYEQETRKIILSMSKVAKVTPSGKQILKNISLGEAVTYNHRCFAVPMVSSQLCEQTLKPLCMTAGMYLGAKIAIMGSNGAGKSTLMRILAGKGTCSPLAIKASVCTSSIKTQQQERFFIRDDQGRLRELQAYT